MATTIQDPGTARKLEFHGKELNGREAEFGGQLSDVQNEVTLRYVTPGRPEESQPGPIKSLASCPCGSASDLFADQN